MDLCPSNAASIAFKPSSSFFFLIETAPCSQDPPPCVMKTSLHSTIPLTELKIVGSRGIPIKTLCSGPLGNSAWKTESSLIKIRLIRATGCFRIISGVSVRSTNGPSSCISPVNSHIITTSDCGITCPAISITGDSAKAFATDISSSSIPNDVAAPNKTGTDTPLQYANSLSPLFM